MKSSPSDKDEWFRSVGVWGGGGGWGGHKTTPCRIITAFTVVSAAGAAAIGGADRDGQAHGPRCKSAT